MKFSLLIQPETIHYVREMGVKETGEQKKLREETEKLYPSDSIMLSSPEQQQLLALILKLMSAKKTLDIGVFTGYSSLTVALALPEDGKIVALDTSEEFTSIGMKYWKEAKVDHKIDLRIQPAAKTLDQLIDAGESETFDFAFIDADKTNYDLYYEKCLKLVRKGGLICFDNVLWSGLVYAPSTTKGSHDAETIALKNLNEKLKKDVRVEIAMATIADGITFCRKL